MVFCLSGISAGCLGLLLPETLNKPAAETLDELSSPTYQRILEPQVHLLEDKHLIDHNGADSDWDKDFGNICTIDQCQNVDQDRKTKGAF